MEDIPHSRKNIRPLDLFFVGVLFLILVSSLVFFFRSERIQNIFSQSTRNEDALVQEDRAFTFTSYQYGVSFSYPSSWRVSTNMYTPSSQSIDSIILTDFSEQFEQEQSTSIAAAFPQDHFVQIELFTRSSAESVTQAFHRLFPSVDADEASPQLSLIQMH